MLIGLNVRFVNNTMTQRIFVLVKIKQEGIQNVLPTMQKRGETLMEHENDDLLKTKEVLKDVNWDTLSTGEMVGEGRHLVKINKVTGESHNFKDYTGIQAVLQMVVQEGPDQGKTIFDRINLPHAQEAKGNQNRRVLIASRMGLIEKGTKENAEINWKILEGMMAVVTVIHKKGTGQNANKTYANVEFDGYEGPETWNAAAAGPAPSGAAASKDAYSDI